MSVAVARIAAPVAVLALAVVLAPAAAQPSATPTSGRVAATALEDGIVAKLNLIRRAHRLTPLRVNPGLTAAARLHSRDMVANGYFEHENLDGKPFWKRVGRFYGAYRGADVDLGENILWASGGLDADGAAGEWMKSPGHRENILDPHWREIGMGAASRRSAPGAFEGLDVIVLTADFGVRTPPRSTLRSASGRP